MESRRVDNQARGRSGRQGDEGSSIFFVSLEDDLMRLFGSETMNSMLEKLGLKDGESIDHPWINKAIERAQQKVEARNFDIRKTLIKFDNVLNDQRHVIFEQRKNVIDGKEKENYSDIFLEEVLDNLKRQKILHEKSPNSKEFPNTIKQILGKSIDNDELDNILNSDLKVMEKTIKDKFTKNREERNNLLGVEQGNEIEKRILVQIIDQNWKSHIQYLEQLRQVIGLRSYGQRDPLVEYKKEAFLLFENLLGKLKTDLVTMLLNLKIIEKKEDDNSENKIKENLTSIAKSKIGRNEPCPCGSGKKYKHCCGAL